MKSDLPLVDPLEHNLATRDNAGDVIVRTAALFPDGWPSSTATVR